MVKSKPQAPIEHFSHKYPQPWIEHFFRTSPPAHGIQTYNLLSPQSRPTTTPHYTATCDRSSKMPHPFVLIPMNLVVVFKVTMISNKKV